MKNLILSFLLSFVLLSCQSKQDKEIKEILSAYSKVHYEKESDNPFLKNKWICLSDTVKAINGDFLFALNFESKEMNEGGNIYPYTNYGSLEELIYLIDPYESLEYVGVNNTYEYIYQEDRIAIYQKDSSGKYISLKESNFEISNDSLKIDEVIYINMLPD